VKTRSLSSSLAVMKLRAGSQAREIRLSGVVTVV
jgi:hypothetical protein